MSFAFDLASRWAGEPEVFVEGAFGLIGTGILGAVAAADDPCPFRRARGTRERSRG